MSIKLKVKTVAAAGTVTGPGSSTDNAIARFDGVSGALIQNSSVTIADTTGAMNFTAASGAHITWSTDGGGDIGTSTSNRPNNIRVRSSVQITNDGSATFQAISNTNVATTEPLYNMSRARGTVAAPLYCLSGDNMGNIAFRTTSDQISNANRTIGRLRFVATENHSAIAAGSRFIVTLALNGTTTETNRFQVSGDGNTSLIGSPHNLIWTTDGGGTVGALGANRPSAVHVTSTINLNSLTASRALISDASKNLISSSVTSTELGYVSGVTSAIQTQLDNKIAVDGKLKLNRTAVSDSDYTVLISDYYVGLTSITATRTFTLPTAASAGEGATLVIKDESGLVSALLKLIIDGDGTETIDGAATFELTSAYESLTLYCDGSNWFIV